MESHKKRKKIKVGSTMSRVSNLYMQDMKEVQRLLNSKFPNMAFSIPASYNMVRPEFLRLVKQRLVNLGMIQRLKLKKKQDLIKIFR